LTDAVNAASATVVGAAVVVERHALQKTGQTIVMFCDPYGPRFWIVPHMSAVKPPKFAYVVHSAYSVHCAMEEHAPPSTAAMTIMPRRCWSVILMMLSEKLCGDGGTGMNFQ